MDFSSGGKKVIERLVDAYGFNTRQALSDHLGVSKSTMATRYMRDIFPSDWGIACALQTGVSLKWLVDGSGEKYEAGKSDIVPLSRLKISNEQLYKNGTVYFDKETSPQDMSAPTIIEDSYVTYIAKLEFNDITYEKWLVSIDTTYSVRDVSRIPNNNIRVTNNNISFECAVNDIEFVANIVKSTV